MSALRTGPFRVARLGSLLVACCLAMPLPSQGLISGRALLPNSTRPLACVDAALRRADGTVVARTFVREDGTFEFAAPAAGRYVVAFSTLGMSEAVASLDSLLPTSDVDRTFAVPLAPVDSLVERVDALRADARFARLASNNIAPRYPAAERSAGLEGGVVAALVVRADGMVDPTLSSILYASAAPFEAAVRDAFVQMRYEPASVGGQFRCSLLVVPFIFELSGGATARSPSYVTGQVATLLPSVVTSPPGGERGVCPPRPAPNDSVPPVYLACHVDREAREARSNAVLNWEPAGGELRPGACFRVEVRFIVDAQGIPEPGTAALISTNNAGFGNAFLALVPDLRYQPARLNGRPVRQVVTFRESIGAVTVDNRGLGVGSATPTRRARC